MPRTRNTFYGGVNRSAVRLNGKNGPAYIITYEFELDGKPFLRLTYFDEIITVERLSDTAPFNSTVDSINDDPYAALFREMEARYAAFQKGD